MPSVRPISGFSLIELMLVVTIVGILACIAIPSYKGYAERARFTEVMGATEIYKTAVALALQEGLPLSELNSNNNGIPNSPTPTRHIASIIVNNGVITATGTKLVDHTTYILTPNADGSQWEISGSCLENGLCHA